MYILRKVGFYITLITLVGGTLAILLMLLIGVQMGNGENPFEAILGLMFVVIAIIALIVAAIVVVLMIFYQRSIVIPLLMLLVFGLTSIGMSSSETPLVYITTGLSIGPLVTVIGYFFKAKPKDNEEIVTEKIEN